jgi:hypothetical protein
MPDDLFVVEVDTRAKGASADIAGYLDRRSNAEYFRRNIIENPNTVRFVPPVATLCGKHIKMYFMKYKERLAPIHRRGGPAAVTDTFAQKS